MLFIFAVTVGVIFACSVYLMMKRSLVRLILGLSLMSYGVNMLLFSMGNLNKRAAPIIGLASVDQIADPLPQALILTAIVISFGVLAFTLTLAYRASQAVGGDDLDALQSTDKEL